MPRFLSNLSFAAFLKYSPYGTTQGSELSRAVRSAIKSDGLLPPAFHKRAIGYAAIRLAEELANYPFLHDFLGPAVGLVPVPRSKPRRGESLWPSLRICEAFVRHGLGSGAFKLLDRKSPVDKSATASAGGRPSPQQHYDTLGATAPELLLNFPAALTLVDDFVTRGSTFLACYARLKETYPQTPIRCFALVRSMRSEEVDWMLDPVLGAIELDDATGRLRRHP